MADWLTYVTTAVQLSLAFPIPTFSAAFVKFMGLSREEVEKRVKDALKRVGMDGFEKKPPHHLSGGQKKRVAIAGILAMLQ